MGWIRRLRGTIGGSRLDRVFDEEARFHLDALAEESVRRGLPPDAARLEALRRFGNVTFARERTHDVDVLRWLADALQDIRFAARTLRKNAGFTLVAVTTLALGVGASTAMFSLADASLLHPLSFPHPDRLVTVNEIVPLIAQRPIRLTAPDLVDFEAESHTFDALGGWTPLTFELSGARESERIQAIRATASFFAVLQAAPALGRTFTADEDRGSAPVCVIGYGLWQRWFGGAPEAVGDTVRLDRVPYKVIGVMPRGFEFPTRAMLGSAGPVDVWVPMSLTPAERASRGDRWNFNGLARLKEGATVAQGTADVDAIAQHIVKDLMPPDRAGYVTFRALVQPLAPQVSGSVRPLVVALVGAVALMLLIACVNVANLFLARGASRRKEIAVRVALGAGRARILRQLLAETLVIAALATLAGSVLAAWLTDAVARFVPGRLSLLGQATLNGRALLFATLVAVATAGLIGIVPGIAATDGRQMEGLGERGLAVGGVRHRRMRSILVIAEIALALVLLVGAGLLIRSFRDLVNTQAGFRPEDAAAGFVSLPRATYPDIVHEREFYRRVLERLAAQPGVDAAGTGTNLPLNGTHSERAFWPDNYIPPPNARFNIVGMTAIGGAYLQALGATLVRGRYFTARDSADAEPVAIVTQSVARRYWPGGDPLGQRLKFGIRESPSPWLTVVGIVADVQSALDVPTSPQIFVPADQIEQSIVEELRQEFSNAELRSMFIVVRGRGTPGALVANLRGAVAGVDPRLALASVRSLAEAVSTSAAPQRFNMLVMTGFAAVALVLAAIGIYGVVAYSVAQRTHEIGVRVALGADPAGVIRLILRDGAGLAVAGVGIGTVAAAALAPALRALLFGVTPLDPPTFASVALLLLAVAALATYVPARRATRVDPLEALRAE